MGFILRSSFCLQPNSHIFRHGIEAVCQIVTKCQKSRWTAASDHVQNKGRGLGVWPLPRRQKERDGLVLINRTDWIQSLFHKLPRLCVLTNPKLWMVTTEMKLMETPDRGLKSARRVASRSSSQSAFKPTDHGTFFIFTAAGHEKRDDRRVWVYCKCEQSFLDALS